MPTVVSEIRTKRLAFLSLLAGAVGIGFAPIWVRLSELGPSATAFYRVLFALPVLWLWHLWEEGGEKPGEAKREGEKQPQGLKKRGDRMRRGAAQALAFFGDRRERKQKWLLFSAGILFAIDMAVWHSSLHRTTVANSTLLANSAPIFVTLGAWLVFRERITALFLSGMVVAMLGAVVLTRASWSESSDQLAGDALALLAAVFYGGYMLCVKQLRKRFSTAVIMAWSGLSSGVGLLVITLLTNEPLMAASSTGWWVLVALALTGQVGGQSLITYAFAHLPASFTSVSLMSQPAVAAILAWVILNEPMDLTRITGAVIILTGIVLARRGSA